ncbi:acylphosphatase [Crenobacter caeni]|uniref:acylphosphatase n=1 Tax=Crenobacter caeni TaxID=2705474 RepID=A0A6B2KNT0_9NEIS|nr:acylphosphatase [Crenobacter caeni]NDV11741.1 acylphosphatase [Crenobacter caeni]
MKACLLRIHGKVQGVYYRDTAVARARELGVAGWVRNRVDGTVEAWVEGEPSAVAGFVEWAHQGPLSARVDRVDASEVSAEAVEGFERKPTL